MPKRRWYKWLFVIASFMVAVGFSVGWLFWQTAPTAEIPLAVGSPWFVETTAESGLEFVHDPGSTPETYFFPKIVGSGAALIDFDDDGRLEDATPVTGTLGGLFLQIVQ